MSFVNIFIGTRYRLFHRYVVVIINVPYILLRTISEYVNEKFTVDV